MKSSVKNRSSKPAAKSRVKSAAALFTQELPGGLRGITNTLYIGATQSTQDIARALAQTGAQQGTLIISGEQTGGRGRLGRQWHSAPGGLYMSIVLRPNAAPADLSELGIAAAHAVTQTLSEICQIKAKVKPPNDVLAFDPAKKTWRKISGISAESSCAGDTTEWITVGIGVNLANTLSRDLDTATTVKRITGQTPDRDNFLRKFFTLFWDRYSAWELHAASKRNT